MAGGLVPQLPQSVRRMSRNFSNAISVVIDTSLMGAVYHCVCVCVSACVYARERESVCVCVRVRACLWVSIKKFKLRILIII